MRSDACLATYVRKEQSTELLELRTICLDARLREFSAVVTMFRTADASIVEHAAQTASELTPLAACSNLSRVREYAELPASVLKPLSHASALNSAGKYKPALASVERALGDATKLANDLAMGEARFVRASIERNLGEWGAAEEDLFEAVRYGAVAGNAHLQAKAWTLLVRATVDAGRLEEAKRWARHAKAAIDRDGSDLELTAELAQHEGYLQRVDLQFESALATSQRAIALANKAFPPRDLHRLAAQLDRGSTLAKLRRYNEVVELTEPLLADWEPVLGADHPRVAWIRNGLGIAYMNLKQYSAAKTNFDTALRILESAGAKTGFAPLANRGGVEELEGNFGAAQKYREELLRHAEQNYEDAHPRLAQARYEAARIAAKRHDFERAESLLLAVRTVRGPPAATATAESLRRLSRERGASREARRGRARSGAGTVRTGARRAGARS
jgi:tetratricopeptide (TPR) repeat protein